jgi:hypothetical protein
VQTRPIEFRAAIGNKTESKQAAAKKVHKHNNEQWGLFQHSGKSKFLVGSCQLTSIILRLGAESLPNYGPHEAEQ